MKNSLHTVYDKYRFEGISQFLNMIRFRKCTYYYASDFLQVDKDDLTTIENSVQRTMEIFKTLQLPIENYFFRIYRANPNYIFKDWKLSKLACIYMFMDGDPTNLRNLAQQQTTLIDQLLNHNHPSHIDQQE